MRSPLTAGKWLLDAANEGWWLERYGIGGADISVRIGDADLRAIHSLCDKALKSRKPKAARGGK